MSIVGNLLSGGLAVSTDFVASNVLAIILTLTTQRELLLMLDLVFLTLLHLAEAFLTSFFATNDTLSPVMERVIIHFVTLPKMALMFVLLRIILPIATELFETSQIRWNDVIVAIVYIFSMLFLFIERNRVPPAASSTGGNVEKSEKGLAAVLIDE